ncbi:MAG: hypothetical protein L0H15_03650 [Nitrosospira sp.]|nr:hypothetical protein [Nitrosospira sp.]MDN5880756.1 hypothetical protein [Nitrosospira sp.]MDN5934563.1 hypothetical protein [Nitrosospira sp.]
MTIRFKEAGMSSAEATLQPSESVSALEVDCPDTIRALMEFYESGQILDDEESEVDLMIQLSGMIYDSIRSDE